MDSSIKYFLRKTEYFSSGLLYFWLLFFPFILTVTGNDSVGVLVNVDYTQLCRNQQLIFCRKFEFSVYGTLTHCSEHLNTFSRRATKEDWFEGSWSWRKRSHWVRSWFYPVKCHWLCNHTTFSYCNDQKYRQNCLVYFFTQIVITSFMLYFSFSYQQYFDLEGESGIVVRGIGTCVLLLKINATSSLPTTPTGFIGSPRDETSTADKYVYLLQPSLFQHTDHLPFRNSKFYRCVAGTPKSNPINFKRMRHNSTTDSDGSSPKKGKYTHHIFYYVFWNLISTKRTSLTLCRTRSNLEWLKKNWNAWYCYRMWMLKR